VVGSGIDDDDPIPHGPMILEEGEEDGSGQVLTPIDLVTVVIGLSDERSGMPTRCFLVH
jgi:hypothetical protein